MFQSDSDNVVDMLPRESDVPGWSKTGSDLYLKKKDIGKLIREYRGLGIERYAGSIYESIDEKGARIKLEIMKFGTTLDAYGFFSVKRGPGIFDTADTNEYYSNSIGLVQSGEYVIFTSTDKTDSLLKKELKTFANIPLLYIGKGNKTNKLPSGISAIRGVDGYGVLYSRKQYHRFPQIRDIYFTQWNWNGELIELFYSDRGSFYDAYELFKKTSASEYILISSDDKYTAFRKEQDGRYCFVSVSDRWIFGCWSVKEFDDGKKILHEILYRLEDNLKKSK